MMGRQPAHVRSVEASPFIARALCVEGSAIGSGDETLNRFAAFSTIAVLLRSVSLLEDI